MTAARLLAALVAAGCRPTIDGPDVVFDPAPPVELARDLDVLLTGVRALLAGKPWLGVDPGTGRFLGRGGALDPSAKLPRQAGLLAVRAAGEQWDRLGPTAATEFADCFEP